MSKIKHATEEFVNGKTINIIVSVPLSWSIDTTGSYTQTITVDGILSTDTPIVDIILGTDISTNAELLKAWSCITRITTADNSITLYANETAPESDFTIQLKVVR